MDSLPQGSNIKIELDDAYQKIVIPHKSGGILRILISLFIMFWLGCWAVGWVTAATALGKGKGAPDFFLMFWLGGWTVGGIVVMFFLYRIMRPPVPETIVLASPNIHYDTGLPPLQISFGFRSQFEVWKQLFKKRSRFEFTAEEIRTLALREHGEGNRLTIDKGNQRVELAIGATELEREWLFETLSLKYS